MEINPPNNVVRIDSKFNKFKKVVEFHMDQMSLFKQFLSQGRHIEFRMTDDNSCLTNTNNELLSELFERLTGIQEKMDKLSWQLAEERTRNAELISKLTFLKNSLEYSLEDLIKSSDISREI